MKEVFDQDQAARNWDRIDWSIVGPADLKRRELTKQMLDRNALHTSNDYEEAAYVYQHGSRSEDFLLAHVLAIIAISKGSKSSAWIATATLDRYLYSTGRPQIFGTQYYAIDTDPHQEPYDRSLISDSLRQELEVPTLAEQAKQLDHMRQR